MYRAFCTPSHKWEGGFLSAELSGKIDALLQRLNKFGYLLDNITFHDLLDKAKEDLFYSTVQTTVVLFTSLLMLPLVRSLDNVRDLDNSFNLFSTNTRKKSFVVRSL